MRFSSCALATLGFLFASSAAAAAESPLPRTPDLVVFPSPFAAFQMTPLAPGGSWAKPAPGGASTVVGADTGRAALYPGARPLPVGELEARMTAFSADGRYLLVASGWHASRDVPAHPTLAVLSMPDLRIVQQVPGMDPEWIGPSTVEYRSGDQTYRLDVNGGIQPIGAPQTALGCRYEDFGPYKPCRAGRSSNVRAMSLSTWFVDDECTTISNGSSYRAACQPAEAFRFFEVATGRSRTLATVSDPLDAIWSSVSPARTRACIWVGQIDRASLSCAAVPGGNLEAILPTGAAGELAWLDEQRILVVQPGRVGIADLAARTWTNVSGLPANAGSVKALPGGRRFVLGRPSLTVVDLDLHVALPGPSGEMQVDPVPQNAHRIVVHARDAAFFTVDL